MVIGGATEVLSAGLYVQSSQQRKNFGIQAVVYAVYQQTLSEDKEVSTPPWARREIAAAPPSFMEVAKLVVQKEIAERTQALGMVGETVPQGSEQQPLA